MKEKHDAPRRCATAGCTGEGIIVMEGAWYCGECVTARVNSPENAARTEAAMKSIEEALKGETEHAMSQLMAILNVAFPLYQANGTLEEQTVVDLCFEMEVLVSLIAPASYESPPSARRRMEEI